MLGVQNPDVGQSTCCSEAWKCSLPCSFKASGDFRQSLTFLGLQLQDSKSLPLLSHGLSRSTSLCLSWFFSFIRTPVVWDLGPTVTHYDIILTTGYVCPKLCFQIRSHSQVPSGCEFGGERDTVEPSACTQGRFTGLFGTA